MKHYLFIIGLIFFATSLSAQNLSANQTEWEYSEVTIDGTEGISLDLYKGESTRVNIPSSIDGKNVIALCFKKKMYAGLFNQTNYKHNNTIEAVNGLNVNLLVIGTGTFNFCKSRIFRVSIPNSVKEIGSYAFAGSNISSFTFPQSLAKMGTHIFFGCNNLSWVSQIPSKVNEIPEGTFHECRDIFLDLSSILHSNIEKIGSHAFAGCRNIQGVFDLKKVTKIGQHAFYGCSSLIGDLILPHTIKDLGIYAFKDCGGLNGAVTLPQSLNQIPVGLFLNCSNITGSIIIPKNIKSIGAAAFADCSSLTGTLQLPEGLETIGDAAFRNTKFTGELHIPSQVNSIGIIAFKDCKNIKTGSYIPNKLGMISDDVFRNSTAYRKNLVFPDQTTYIGYNSFSGSVAAGAREIKSITFSENFHLLSETAFLGTTKTLKYITVKAKLPPGIRKWVDKRSNRLRRKTPDEIVVFDDEAYTNATLYVPTGCIETYRNDSFWGKFVTIKEVKPTAVGDKELEKPYQIITTQRKIRILSSSKINTIKLYDIQGRILENLQGDRDNLEINPQHKGVVIIKIICNNGQIFTEKMP
ncbi:leucine-rich repeat domain-containing protein [Prolixibacteraceae bacterium]|nr:leucine-rich repeat domain-containing protein [Prolixibacteraceae bacterium]